MSVQNPVFRNDHIAYKKILQKCIKATKAKYLSNKLKNSVNDSKSTWKILNGLLRPNRSSFKIKLTIIDQILTTPVKDTDASNDYFSIVANLLDEVFQAQQHHLCSTPTENQTHLYFLRQPPMK